MNVTKHYIFRERRLDPDNGAYYGYGIYAESGRERRRIPNITSRLATAEELKDWLDRNDVSIEHFHDVVEDYVSALSMS